jgi:hypothetical protein
MCILSVPHHHTSLKPLEEYVKLPPKWLRNKTDREILDFVGGGIAALCIGGFALFKYLKTPDYKATVRYTLCVGPPVGKKWCPVYSLYVAEGTVSDWVNKECSKYANKTSIGVGAGSVEHREECRCELVFVTCSN